jgi:ribose/xylose/arabinose/galactoside ABC-type transport system permease subunit
MALGTINGVIITAFNVHSFLVTLATALVYRGVSILITDGKLIPVRIAEFAWLGREKIGMVNVAVIVMLCFMALMMFILNRTTLGRAIFAVGGNEEAALLSGIRTDLVKIITFALSGGCRVWPASSPCRGCQWPNPRPARAWSSTRSPRSFLAAPRSWAAPARSGARWRACC